MNNDDFTVLVSGGGRRPWVTMCAVWLSHSKWLNEQSYKCVSNCALSWTFHPTNYSDDSKGCSYGQLVIGSFITTMRPLIHHVSCRIFGKTLQYSDDSGPLQPIFGALQLLAFPKTKITLEREEILDHQWYSGKYDRAADGEELCEVPRYLLWRGLRHHCPMSSVFCILYLIQ